jgi:hypothetical protein
MSELWFYAEGEEQRGPVSPAELIAHLSKLVDPQKALIWRHGFEEWQRVETVVEIARQVMRPPPLRPRTPPEPPPIREPAIGAEEAAQFKDIKPELTGIGGWLVLVVFGQVVGLVRLIVSNGEYYAKDASIAVLFERFPATAWGEVALNVSMVALVVYTTVLLFQKSRAFPRFFILQVCATIFLPIFALLWVGFTLSFATGTPFGDLINAVDHKDFAQIGTGIVGAMIWIPYMLRSRRVANTFVN